jgi:sulfur-oxidizing protein SoxY
MERDTMKFQRTLSVSAFCALLAAMSLAVAQTGRVDPLDSARWGDMHHSVLADAPFEFDDRVRVIAPTTAENPMQVPVTVDATALPGSRRCWSSPTSTPSCGCCASSPGGAGPAGFRVKLQQSTPVRAAARTADGRWHVGGTWVNTVGGGCTAPSAAAASTEWQRRLNEVSGRQWTEGPNAGRLRLRIVHPMDTGLVAGTPAFHLEEINFTDAAGKRLMRVETFEPVSENPVFTLQRGALAGPVDARGRDNNGNAFDARIAP